MQNIRLRLVFALLFALPSSGATRSDRLFVFEASATTATVLSAPDLTPLDRVEVARGAFTALQTRGRTYVAAPERVTIFNDALERIGEIPFSREHAEAAALDPGSGDLLVAGGGRLYRIDTAENRIAAEIETGFEATAIYVPDGARRAYLLATGSRQAKVVDLIANAALPGTVDLAASPSVISEGVIGAGAEVFSLERFSSGVGGATSASNGAALLAASASGATLHRTAGGLLHRAGDGVVTELASPGAARHTVLAPAGDVAYLALEDGRIASLTIGDASANATAWLASAPTGIALASEAPQQQVDILTKVSGDEQAVLSGSSFEIVVSGPIGGIPMTVTASNSAAQCDDVPPLSGVTTIDCMANTVNSTTTVMLTVSSGGDTEIFTIFVFPAGLPDGLFKISGDNQTVGAGGSAALVVEARSGGGLPNAGASLGIAEASPALTCPGGLTTNAAGRATINCSVAGAVPVSEVATVTVTDPAMNSVDFTLNILGQTGSNDTLQRITPDPINIFEEQSFQITVLATLNNVPQPNVPLTISGGGGVVLCPPNAVTGGNGEATLLCAAGALDENTTVQVTISDGSNNLVYTINVTNSTLIDGLQKISGDNQTVLENTQFPLALVVRAVSDGMPQEGLLLSVLPSNSAATCSVSTLTDSNGLGSITCNANSVASVTQVTIQVTDATNRMLAQPFLATINPDTGGGGSATAISIIAGSNLAARVGDTLFGALQVRTEDGNGVAVPTTTVFARAPQGIAVNPASLQTNIAGLGAFDLTFGCAIPAGQIQLGLASNSTEATATYTLSSGPLSQFEKIQGDSQSGVPGARLPLALVVRSADQCGSSLPNVPLTWSVLPPEAAALEAFTPTTNSQGLASVLVRPSSLGGAFQVRATSALSETAIATFTLTTQNAPTQLSLVSGNQQVVPAGMDAAAPLVVRVLNAMDQPVQGVTVSFQVVSGSGTLGATTAISDATGQAGTTFTAGALRGPVLVRATAAGLSVDFNLTVGGGAPQVPLSGIVNGASFQPGLVSGSTGSIFGVNITEDVNGALLAPFTAGVGFPTLFRGVRVTVAGVPAPILSLANVNGQEQINIQTPFGLQQGVVTVVVENNGSQAVIEGVPVFGEQPGIFEFNLGSQRLAAVLHADFSVVTPSNPARPGEVLLLFVTGLGRVSPPVATNQIGPASPLAQTETTPLVSVNGVGQEVLASVYAPQLVSAYQINFRLRSDTPPGLLRIRIESDGAASQEAFLPAGAAF